MAGKYLVAALLGLVLNVYCSDIVYEDKVAVPLDIQPLGYHTSTGYPTLVEEQEEEIAPLSCYDCTSYMSSCKREVRDVGGQIVSRTGCKTKCFLRVGEEQSGALYRGCMDDFLSASALTQDYVGCRVQEWNGKKSLWCLCGDDLCNGQSLKGLFYYGFGSPNKLQYLPDGKAYLVESVDERFNAMTSKVHNYNRKYEEEHLPEEPLEEPSTLSHEENLVDRPLEAYPGESRPLEDPDRSEQLAYPQEQPGVEEFSRQEVYEKRQYPAGRQEESESYGKPQAGAYEEHPYGFLEEHHLPYTAGFPAYPINSPEQLPEEQFLQPPPSPEQYPSDSEVMPPYYQYPQYPGLSNQLKYPSEEKVDTEAVYPEGAQDEQLTNTEQFRTPEGKSAVLSPLQPAPFPAFLPRAYYKYPAAVGYPYHYGGDLELEPLSYSPEGNEEEAVLTKDKQVHGDQQQEVDAAPAPDVSGEQLFEEQPPEEELDSELYCPAAGIFTYEEDCSKFVMCLIDHIHGKPRMYVMKCPADLVFDSVANTCMQPEMSNGCKRLPAPEPVATSAPELHERPGRYEGYGDGYEASNVNQVFDYAY